jgi:hypothetical protein
VRLLPQSLFGRLVLVLLGGLALAQLVTAYINLSERGQLLYQAGGMRIAERIADISKLLDSLPRAERRRVVAVFNAPPLTISLDRLPMAAGDEPQETDMRLSMFRSVLRYALGDELQIKLIRREGAPQSFQTQGRFSANDMPMMSRHGRIRHAGFLSEGSVFYGSDRVARRDLGDL